MVESRFAALNFLQSKQQRNKENVALKLIGRVPNAANELSGKPQVPTETRAAAAAKCINAILVFQR